MRAGNLARCAAGAVAALLSVVWTAPSVAGTNSLLLSTISSDETSPGVLDARFVFDVTGSTLTFTAFNLTSAPNEFNMNELFFNAGGGITGLSAVTIPTGWTFQTSQAADGFGVFDFALIDGVGQNPAQIQPGASASFIFTILGVGDSIDFVTAQSTIPPGETPALAAAKFVGGPGDDSAFGAVVIPAPGSGLILLAGLPGLRRRRR